MELFKSLEKRTKLFSEPFKHFEINQPLTQNAIDEICSAEIVDPIARRTYAGETQVVGQQVARKEPGRRCQTW